MLLPRPRSLDLVPDPRSTTSSSVRRLFTRNITLTLETTAAWTSVPRATGHPRRDPRDRPALPHREQRPAPGPTHPHRLRPHPEAPPRHLRTPHLRPAALTWVTHPSAPKTRDDLHVHHPRANKPGNSRQSSGEPVRPGTAWLRRFYVSDREGGGPTCRSSWMAHPPKTSGDSYLR